MAASKGEIYLHFVWAAYRRMPLVTVEIERDIYRCIEDTLRKMDISVLALNGLADHVHLAIVMPTKHSPAEIMKRVKGVSSTVGRNLDGNGKGLFAWQDGYAVFSFRRKDCSIVIDYIERQKERHLEKKVWADWELE